MPDTLVWFADPGAPLTVALAQTLPFPDARVIAVAAAAPRGVAEHVPADLGDPDTWPGVEAHFLAPLGGADVARVVLVAVAGAPAAASLREADAGAYRRNVVAGTAAPQVLANELLTALVRGGFRGDAAILVVTGGAGVPGDAALRLWAETVTLELRARERPWRVAVVSGVPWDVSGEAAATAARRIWALLGDSDAPVVVDVAAAPS